jgi:CheY-like chemotaxis protein
MCAVKNTRKKTFFRLTSEGRALWSRREELAMPEEYRRVLALVEADGHKEVIRSRLARYPDEVVERWLNEFEATNLIEAIAARPPKLSQIARKAKLSPLEAEEQRRFDDEADYADISLTRLGIYVSHERVRHRPPSRKVPRETIALVVEDDPDQLALAVLRLTTAGYRVHAVQSVKALLESLKKQAPDAIFLDVMLPDGDGFDVLANLRLHPAYALLPIVMVTAKAEPQDVSRGLALGADAYVTKPYGGNTLDYVLRYVLNQPAPDYVPPA